MNVTGFRVMNRSFNSARQNAYVGFITNFGNKFNSKPPTLL